jgi:hypothetical protein
MGAALAERTQAGPLYVCAPARAATCAAMRYSSALMAPLATIGTGSPRRLAMPYRMKEKAWGGRGVGVRVGGAWGWGEGGRGRRGNRDCRSGSRLPCMHPEGGRDAAGAPRPLPQQAPTSVLMSAKGSTASCLAA